VAGVTFGGSAWTTTAGNKTVTLTPAVGDLLFVFCANSGRTTAQPPTVSCDVQGITFSQFTGTNGSFTKNTSADSGWIFLANSFCTAASSTIVTMTQSSDSGGGLFVFRVSSMTRAGTDAVRQCGKQDNAAAATPSITMPNAILTGNPVFGLVFNGTNSATTTAPPTSWTEDFDNGYNTPASGAEVVHRASGETLTTIAWTAASASAFGSIIAELDTTSTTPAPTVGALNTFRPFIVQ
jgi:hypothetical protein